METKTITLNDIYREYADYIKALIYKLKTRYNIKLSYDEHKDIEQECFIKLINAHDDYNRWESPKSYIFIMVRNCFLDYCKKLMTNNTVDLYNNDIVSNIEMSLKDNITGTDNITEKIIVEQYIKEVNKLITKLSPKQQLIFKMRYYDGCTQSDVAILLKISQSSVSENESYVLKFLKSELTTILGNFFKS